MDLQDVRVIQLENNNLDNISLYITKVRNNISNLQDLFDILFQEALELESYGIYRWSSEIVVTDVV